MGELEQTMNFQKTFLISVLGTNDYLACRYYHENAPDNLTEPVRFVQEAIIYLMPETERNRLETFIYLTEEAKNKNWLNDGHGRQCEGLESRLARRNINSTPVDIPIGKSEKEIWKIFQKIVDSIPESSRLIVDITHSFRSVSMILLAALRYAKTVKKVDVAAIYYGAMEASGSIPILKKMKPAERKVPIFDMTPFDAILDWSEAASDFIYSGSAAKLRFLAEERIIPILKKTKGKDEQAKIIRKFVKNLDDFCSNISTNRGPSIQKESKIVEESLLKAKQTNILEPLFPLFEQIEQEVREFGGDSLDIALQTAKWCLKHNFLPQGFTALQEGLITWCLEKIGDSNVLEIGKREAVMSAFAIFNKKIPKEQWNENAKNNIHIIEQIFELPNIKILAKSMDKLSNRRNNINHGGFNQDQIKPETFKKDLDRLVKEISSWKKQNNF